MPDYRWMDFELPDLTGWPQHRQAMLVQTQTEHNLVLTCLEDLAKELDQLEKYAAKYQQLVLDTFCLTEVTPPCALHELVLSLEKKILSISQSLLRSSEIGKLARPSSESCPTSLTTSESSLSPDTSPESSSNTSDPKMMNPISSPSTLQPPLAPTATAPGSSDSPDSLSSAPVTAATEPGKPDDRFICMGCEGEGKYMTDRGLETCQSCRGSGYHNVAKGPTSTDATDRPTDRHPDNNPDAGDKHPQPTRMVGSMRLWGRAKSDDL